MRELSSPAVHASRNAFSPSSQALRGLGIAIAATVVLAYLGPMGTYQASFGHRFAYWAAVILPGSLLGTAVLALVRHWRVFSRHRWLEILVVALLISLPHSFVVIVVSALFFGIGMITPMVVVQFWLTVLMIALVLTVINYLATPAAAQAGAKVQGEMLEGPAQPPAPTASTALPAAAEALPAALPEPVVAASPDRLPALPALLVEKLPYRLRAGRLLGIEAEDHYLRVHTDLGSDLILMRMTDACALLGEADGARVHRSWWVARAAVVTATAQSGRMDLQLTGGQTAPVSRTMQPVLRREGWV